MNKNLINLSALGLFIALLSGCSATSKECVKSTKSVEESSKIAETTPAKEIVKAEKVVKTKAVVKAEPVVVPKKVVQEKPVVTKAAYVDPRDALIKRRQELEQKRLATERSYDEKRL